MKSVIIASNHSGGGKTTFTLGLMNLLKKRGFDVQGYKVGPDYIDTAFHKRITKKGSRNLDVHLMSEDGVRYNYLKGNGEFGIIEGVMGLYDGMGSSLKASTYDISRILGNMPIILVLSPKGISLTLCAEINGLKNFKNANIQGILLNNVSEKYYKLLKYEIEENCKIKVLGFMPKDESISLKSRHLGLVQSSEIDDLNEKINNISNLIEKYVDMEALLSIMQEYNSDISRMEAEIIKFAEEVKSNKPNMKIGVAYDKAFSFYYENNLEILKTVGDIVYFSPMEDERLPENLDFLYIGGGYPEIFKEVLSKNISMRNSIKQYLEAGLRCYAECGGLMYLTQAIDETEMTGFFNGKSFMTKRLNNFGYCIIKIMDGSCENISINAHEFHKSYVEINRKTIYEVYKEQYDGNVIRWKCGYKKKNTLAGYAHVNFLNNIDFLKKLLIE